MIRTINERLRTNKKIVLERDHTGLSDILFGLRMNAGPNKLSPFERHYGRKPGTILNNLVCKPSFLATDPNLELNESDFAPDQDSTILVRERSRGSKLDGTFAKKRAYFVRQSPHTLTVQHPGQSQTTTYSKRDLAESPLTRYLRDGDEWAEAAPVTIARNLAEMEGTKKLTHKMTFSVTSPMKRLRSRVQDRYLRKKRGHQSKRQPKPKDIEPASSSDSEHEDNMADTPPDSPPTTPEQSASDDLVDLTQETSGSDESQEPTPEIKQEREPTKPVDSSPNVPTDVSTETEKNKMPTRKGSRNRKKVNQYGHNIMACVVEKAPRKAAIEASVQIQKQLPKQTRRQSDTDTRASLSGQDQTITSTSPDKPLFATDRNQMPIEHLKFKSKRDLLKHIVNA